jgi:hypothetical protein
MVFSPWVPRRPRRPPYFRVRGRTVEVTIEVSPLRCAMDAKGAMGAAERIETLHQVFRGTPDQGLDGLCSPARRLVRWCDPASAWSSAGPGAWPAESVRPMGAAGPSGSAQPVESGPPSRRRRPGCCWEVPRMWAPQRYRLASATRPARRRPPWVMGTADLPMVWAGANGSDSRSGERARCLCSRGGRQATRGPRLSPRRRRPPGPRP